MRTNIDLDDRLIERAFAITGLRTKKELVNFALAELVKIDPKSIGVGQYQHDVDQSKLKQELDTVVMSCVNSVGINVNTASVPLLSYVSGIGEKLAENIVTFRSENGPLKSILKKKLVR